MNTPTPTPTAIVTGAGSGIGRQTALLLGDEGYRQVLVGRTRSKLEETAQMIRQQHGTEIPIQVAAVDLCDPASATEVIDLTVRCYGRIDVVAHVAGDAPLLDIEKITPSILRRCIDINLSAAVLLAAASWPTMTRQQSGIFVNVSSIASVDPFPGFSIYASAKAGLNMFTRCIAQQGQAIGITSVSIAPGAVETPMLRGLFDESAIPPEKTLQPRDVARVIVECVTGSRDFEPGQTILLPSP